MITVSETPAAIGVGIGASITTLSVFKAMSGDPIPEKTHQLYMVQIDNWGPDKPDEKTEDDLEENPSYIDAMEVLNLYAAKRLTRIYTFYTNVPDGPTTPHRLLAGDYVKKGVAG